METIFYAAIGIFVVQAPPKMSQKGYTGCADNTWNGTEIRNKILNAENFIGFFFYDCPPLTKKEHNPVTGQAIDFSKTQTAQWRNSFHDELRKLRKLALRLGYLNERMGHWTLRSKKLKELLSGKIQLSDLQEDDICYETRQKGVDMRIGLDIASMAFNNQVSQIILVAGDSDFVPAAKLARREGIDFILDPMWGSIRHDLHEHIDGLRSVIKKDGNN